MGQKVNPTGFRTGVTLGWKSRWFAPKSNYGEFLVEDQKIRKFLDDRLNRQPPFAAVSAIEIERTREEVKVLLKTARPGIVIGPKGAEVDSLKNALEDLTNRRVNINIVEIRNPDLDAKLVAEGISEQLKRRTSFRRAMKQRAESAMQAGAKGVKIMLSGRLGGAEMSRTESTILGSIPLHTLEADVDYGYVPCFTTYGAIGVKVWLYRGLFGEQEPEQENAPQAGGRRGGPGGGRQRRAPRGPRNPRRGQGAPTTQSAETPTPDSSPANVEESAPRSVEPKNENQ
jgi:small subunit ribosomal protein S3